MVDRRWTYPRRCSEGSGARIHQRSVRDVRFDDESPQTPKTRYTITCDYEACGHTMDFS